MRFDIAHDVRVTYGVPVWEQHLEVRLTPLRNAHQQISAATVEIEPTCEPRRHRDCFGNSVHACELIAPHEHLTVRSRARVETSLQNPFDYPVIALPRERDWFAERLREEPRLWDYVLHRSALTPDLRGLSLPGLTIPTRQPDRLLFDCAVTALEWVGESIDLHPGFTPSPVKLEDGLAARSGTCQDLAHLLISIVRGWGVPARYAMGYQDPGYADDDAQPCLHAWAEIFIPGAGWRGFDPSTRLIANETYVAVAVGRDAADAMPLKTVFKGGEEAEKSETAVVVEVTRDQ